MKSPLDSAGYLPHKGLSEQRREFKMTNLDTKRFKEICEAHRESFDPEYWMSFRQSLKVEIEDEFGIRTPKSVIQPATFDVVYTMLKVAASKLQNFGASDGQCRAIAARWLSEGATLAQCEMNTLSANEARLILG